ncbi:MAG: tetratricopeptide repeat protein [Flavobacteriaceae bacterium]|nr:tetratricopeptide repeat protein [Flavobacteriaceae bacterium]
MQQFPDDRSNLALSKFESMLKLNKVFFFDSDEFENIVYFYLDSGKINLANKAVELGLSQHPTSIRLKLIKVELLIFENKLKEADRLINTLEKLDPNFDEIYIQKAAILSKKNLHKEAVNVLKMALDLTDDLADIHSLIGMEYLFIEKFDLAMKHFKACLYIDNEDYTALYNVIYCLDMNENNKEAIVFLNDFIDENPYSEVAWHQLGRQYFYFKNYNEAIRAFDYAILIDAHFVGAYFEKAKVLEEQKKYEEAISNYLITLELDDPTAFTCLQIASCYEKLANMKKAIHYYHKAIQEDPMLEIGWVMLTRTYISIGNNQKALYFIQKALEIDPACKDYLNLFAEVNIKLNLFEEAAKAFQESILLGEENLEVFLALADVLHFIGEYQDALAIVNEAKEKFGSLTEICYRLSGIYFLLRNDNEGLFYLENALKLDFAYFETMKVIFPNVFEKEIVKCLIAKFS